MPDYRITEALRDYRRDLAAGMHPDRARVIAIGTLTRAGMTADAASLMLDSIGGSTPAHDRLLEINKASLVPAAVFVVMACVVIFAAVGYAGWRVIEWAVSL